MRKHASTNPFRAARRATSAAHSGWLVQVAHVACTGLTHKGSIRRCVGACYAAPQTPLRYPRQLMAAVAAAAAPTRARRPPRCPPAALGCARAASPCAPARRLVLMSRGAPLTRRTRWRMPARGPSCTGGHALSACSCSPLCRGYARSGSGAAADAALPSPAGAPIRKVVQDFLKIPAREIEKAA